jgi:hypothetical protein
VRSRQVPTVRTIAQADIKVLLPRHPMRVSLKIICFWRQNFSTKSSTAAI